MELVTRGEQERIREAKRISRLGRNLNYENANFIRRKREREREKERSGSLARSFRSPLSRESFHGQREREREREGERCVRRQWRAISR